MTQESRQMVKQEFWLAIHEDGMLKLVMPAGSSADVMKLARNEEFVKEHPEVVGKHLRVAIIRDEPLLVVKFETGICPHCKRPMDKETLVVTQISSGVEAEAEAPAEEGDSETSLDGEGTPESLAVPDIPVAAPEIEQPVEVTTTDPANPAFPSDT